MTMEITMRSEYRTNLFNQLLKAANCPISLRCRMKQKNPQQMLRV